MMKYGLPQYYDENGKSSKRTIMKTPINGAKLTSRYGNRKHPVLVIQNYIEDLILQHQLEHLFLLLEMELLKKQDGMVHMDVILD